MADITWTNETRRLRDLKPQADNPREIKKDQAERLVDSWHKFGQPDVISVNPDNTILNGHQRFYVWGAAYGLDFEVAVRVASRQFTRSEWQEYTVVSHEGAVGRWDWEGLANWEGAGVAELVDWGFDEATLLGAGFEFDDNDEPPPLAQMDKADELQEKWGVKTGDLWKIGRHRLVCGDCTDAEVVARVMGGESFFLCATSPPYTDQREYGIGAFNWLELANGFIDRAFEMACDGSNILVNLGLSHKDGRVNRYWDAWLNHCENTHPLYGWYVWDKGSGIPGEWNGRLAPAHEFLFHFRVGKVTASKWVRTTGESKKRGVMGKRFRQKDGSLKELTSPHKIGQSHKIPDSVVRITREMARGIHTQVHPAVFSVEIAEFFLRTWSDKDQIVYDPFLGSGTTLVACEQLNRRGRGIEIEPKYCAVTLERLAGMGLEPVRIESN